MPNFESYQISENKMSEGFDQAEFPSCLEKVAAEQNARESAAVAGKYLYGKLLENIIIHDLTVNPSAENRMAWIAYLRKFNNINSIKTFPSSIKELWNNSQNADDNTKKIRTSKKEKKDIQRKEWKETYYYKHRPEAVETQIQSFQNKFQKCLRNNNKFSLNENPTNKKNSISLEFLDILKNHTAELKKATPEEKNDEKWQQIYESAKKQAKKTHNADILNLYGEIARQLMDKKKMLEALTDINQVLVSEKFLSLKNKINLLLRSATLAKAWNDINEKNKEPINNSQNKMRDIAHKLRMLVQEKKGKIQVLNMLGILYNHLRKLDNPKKREADKTIELYRQMEIFIKAQPIFLQDQIKHTLAYAYYTLGMEEEMDGKDSQKSQRYFEQAILQLIDGNGCFHDSSSGNDYATGHRITTYEAICRQLKIEPKYQL